MSRTAKTAAYILMLIGMGLFFGGMHIMMHGFGPEFGAGFGSGLSIGIGLVFLASRTARNLP